MKKVKNTAMLLAVACSFLLVAGCEVPKETRLHKTNERIMIAERDGLECAIVIVSAGGGVSCNWERYNKLKGN